MVIPRWFLACSLLVAAPSPGGVRVLQQPWDAAGEGAALRGAHMGVFMVKAGLGVTSP